jgi:hypothetical protein
VAQLSTLGIVKRYEYIHTIAIHNHRDWRADFRLYSHANDEAGSNSDSNRTTEASSHCQADFYKTPEASFHNGIWTVSYYPKSAWQDQYRLPGGTPHFFIIVDDSTGMVHSK